MQFRMSTHCRRAALAGIVGMGLSACGLQPVYAPGADALALRNAVDVTAPPTVAGFGLREQVIRRLGTAAEPRFDLAVTLSSSRAPAAIAVDGDTTRFNLTGTAQYTLTERATGGSLTGSVRTFSSYSATGSTVATQAAEDDAAARLSVALADLIVSRLLAGAAP